jgi:hypothetical protein
VYRTHTADTENGLFWHGKVPFGSKAFRLTQIQSIGKEKKFLTIYFFARIAKSRMTFKNNKYGQA